MSGLQVHRHLTAKSKDVKLVKQILILAQLAKVTYIMISSKTYVKINNNFHARMDNIEIIIIHAKIVLEHAAIV